MILTAAIGPRSPLVAFWQLPACMAARKPRNCTSALGRIHKVDHTFGESARGGATTGRPSPRRQLSMSFRQRPRASPAVMQVLASLRLMRPSDGRARRISRESARPCGHHRQNIFRLFTGELRAHRICVPTSSPGCIPDALLTLFVPEHRLANDRPPFQPLSKASPTSAFSASWRRHQHS